MLSLKVSDSVSVPLSLQAAALSPTLANSPADAEISFSGASEASVRSLCAYLEEYKSGATPSAFQRPLVSADLAESGGNAFDCEFVANMTQNEVHELLQIAEKLEVASLVELMAACVARTLRLWKATGNMRMEAGFRE